MAAGDESMTLCLGSAGEIVRILTAQTTARCKVFQIEGKSNAAAMRPGVEVVSCASWGTRMDHFLAGDGFIFFHGAEGTKAHLVPVLAHIKKKAARATAGQKKAAPPPRVPRIALVNWLPTELRDLRAFMGIGTEDFWFYKFRNIKDAFVFVQNTAQ
ncbi:MAG: hypothetical protein HYV34_04710 [Candidatus Kerfeldbacteria bacterium]|nr:hypothetical protein [Candidatus Kerfeldbacteria bacterium]